MRIVRFVPLLVLAIVGFAVQPADGVLQFYKVFESEYLADHPDQEFVTLVKKPTNRCFVCHQGKKRTNRNAFGQPLAELLDAKQDARDKEKIASALKEVVAMHVDADDESSETFRDRIAASKWPGGELEDLKQEPAE